MDDISQGSLGDCYFMAAAAMAATVGNEKGDGKHIARKVLPIDATPDAGIFPLTFFSGDGPKRIYIDSYLPQKNQSGGYYNLFAKLGHDGAYWVPMFEKAWAKFNGNFNQIVGGSEGEAMYALTGAPYHAMIKYDPERQSRRYSNNFDTFDELWSAINGAFEKGYTVSVGTKGNGDDSLSTSSGMAQSHAYQVLGTKECGSTKLINLRNPWRSEDFKSEDHS